MQKKMAHMTNAMTNEYQNHAGNSEQPMAFSVHPDADGGARPRPVRRGLPQDDQVHPQHVRPLWHRPEPRRPLRHDRQRPQREGEREMGWILF